MGSMEPRGLETAEARAAKREPAGLELAGSRPAGAAGRGLAGAGAARLEDLRAYYDALPCEGGLASACHMAVNGVDLAGKRILDVGCRRGKGAYKLSDLAGPEGFVLGVDWRPAFVEQAQEGAAAALARSGLSASNLAFHVAYPEALAAAGIEDGAFDVVYLNNSVTLLYDPPKALRECARALTPEGTLVLEVAATDAAQPADAIEAARAAGDSAGAARTEKETRAWLRAAGFAEAVVVERIEIAGADKREAEIGVGAASTPQPARLSLLTLQARKLF